MRWSRSAGRTPIARDAQLLTEVLGLLVRALFAFQRRTARRLGVSRPLTGAVAFVQRFGSALQLTPHFHVLVPDPRKNNPHSREGVQVGSGALVPERGWKGNGGGAGWKRVQAGG
jgi:hypothetical protein